MAITQNIIDEVLQKVNIVDIIGKHLKLKRSGNNFFAHCPFHQEKSGSLSINTIKQYYHCFGCDASGDAITFVMKYNGLDFIEAVKTLAQEYNIIIPDDTSYKLSKQDIKLKKEYQHNLDTLINDVVKYYSNNLLQNSHSEPYIYLQKRGLSMEIINFFNIGYAKNQYNDLSKVFNQENAHKLLLESGLINNNHQNKIYDRFYNRIIFPIKNYRGKIIGFGGRVIDNSEPKYLNSPESPIFNKSEELYGLFESIKTIQTKNYVIVVEGYLDVISLFQFGITNVVATMGTSLSDFHIKKLFKLCDTIYYCFDGDNAGKKAAWRALNKTLPFITDIKNAYFTFLPNSHDPDSFIRENTKEYFLEYLLNNQSNSIPLSKFLLNQLLDEVNINTPEGKARLISLFKPFLEQTKALALQVILKQELAIKIGLTPQVLESILNNRTKYAFYNNYRNNYNNKKLHNAYQLENNTQLTIINTPKYNKIKIRLNKCC